jgi:hypothetical protein
MFLFNSDEQPEEKFDLFSANIRLDHERSVWLWCSWKLRPQWERVVKCPVAIAMGLAELEVSQSEDEGVASLTVHPFGTAKLTLEDITLAMDMRPDNLLELALFESMPTPPVYLDDIRAEYCHNERLDAISKLTMAREKRFGDSWFEEGYHPRTLLAEWAMGFNPLREALKRRFLDERKKLERMRREIVGAVDLDELRNRMKAAISMVRETPSGLLNLITRRRLLDACERASGELDMEELFGLLYEQLSPGIKDSIERAGYSVEQTIVDFLGFDTCERREDLQRKRDFRRPRLP